MAEKKTYGQRLQMAAQQLRKRHEAHILHRQLEQCRMEMSVEMEKYGQACFEDGSQREMLKNGLCALKRQENSLEKRIDQLKGVLRCPDCSQEMGEGDAFCRHCGRSMHKTAANAQILWPEEKENAETE